MADSSYIDLFQGLFLGLYILVIGFLVWKVKQFDSKDLITRSEVHDIVQEKTVSLQNDFIKLEAKIDTMSSQVVQIGVTLARIDERMKRDNK